MCAGEARVRSSGVGEKYGGGGDEDRTTEEKECERERDIEREKVEEEKGCVGRGSGGV